MSNYRSQADASQKAKANRIISSAGGGKHSAPFGEGGSTATKRKGYANGGMVDDELIEGEMPTTRLDRPSRNKGKGSTTVNVIVAQKEPEKPAMPPMGLGAVPPGPPPPPPAGPPPGAMPPGLMGRKRGGRVNMDAGSGSAEGRLEKMKAYGGKAKARG